MCVSGSLISSRTCRSSSVSAPCITSSIFLSSSRARSRTSRGSLFHALPIGCMRVFMTPSCRSEVMCDSRCSGTLNAESSCERAQLEQLVAGQHQLADQRHQAFQHIDADPDGLARHRRLGRRRVGQFAAPPRVTAATGSRHRDGRAWGSFRGGGSGTGALACPRPPRSAPPPVRCRRRPARLRWPPARRRFP